MTKSEFVSLLKDGLSVLPKKDVEERLTFYSEMIDDRMDDGISEEDAVAEIGPVAEIVGQILEEYPHKQKRKLGVWEIVLLVLGFPLWFPLLIAAFSVIVSFFAVLWSIVICVWSVEVALWGSALGCFVGGVLVMSLQGNIVTGIVLLGFGFICTGLSIFLFYGCKLTSKGMLYLTKWCWLLLVKLARKGRC